jgi:hypothetical protein
MSPILVTRTHEEIVARKAALVAQSGLDLQTLLERGEDGMLSPEQGPIFHEVEYLMLLLGE